MSYTITATAPTAYRLSSLNAFGMGYIKCGNGSFSASMVFDSEESAKDYLEKRADLYNDSDLEGSDAKLAIMFSDIKSFGILQLDAVTAHIEEVEEEEDITIELVDSWNNAVEGIHYETYSDGSTESRVMTEEEKIAELK